MFRYVHTFFCEDIRQELGGRYSLMGILGAELIVPVPVLLPKLCINVSISSPTTEPYRKVCLRLLLDEDLVAEQLVNNIDDFYEGGEVPEAGASDADSSEGGGVSTRSMATFNLLISPFRVEKSGSLKVRVRLDDGDEIKGGALRLKIDPATAQGQDDARAEA